MNIILKGWFLVIISSLSCLAQQSDLDFLIQKIKITYPGYAEKTKDINFDEFVAKTIENNKADTFKSMGIIVSFFQDRHLDLFRIADPIDTVLCKRNISSLHKYFSTAIPKERFEGFWLSEHNHCIIAIKQTNERPLRYKAFVIECRDSQMIYPGLEYYAFEQSKGNVFFTKATSSASRSKFYLNSIFRNDTVMTSGPYNKWKKLRGYDKPLLAKLIESDDLSKGKWLDKNTYLITIPSSNNLNGTIIDSLIKTNQEITKNAKNLIIDLRNNTGGSSQTYSALWQLIYTNPIVKPNASVYCTNDAVSSTKEQIDSYLHNGKVDSSYLADLRALLKQEEDSMGKFIDAYQDTIKLDKILTYPKNVGIIINYACQSAAELFLLNAKQSKKVKLFGEHTMGAVDYLDFYAVELTSKKYKLYLPSTRRIIPKGESKLDGIGIYPDIPISDKETDWIEFVREYYEKK